MDIDRVTKGNAMKLARTIIILLSVTITMLLAWQANSPAYAKGPVPVCRGSDMLAALENSDPKAYQALLKREKAIVNGQGLLWKIERAGQAASYLYGTMHMSDDRLTTLPGPVADVLDGATTVALELDELLDDAKMQMEVIKNIKLIAFTDGRTLDSVLSPAEIKLLKRALKKHKMPYAATRVLKPWFVMLSLALPMCEMERQQAGLKALDAQIARTAIKNGAKLVGLETVREQFAAFEGMALKDQRAFLVNSLRMSHLLDDQIETMTQLYLQRRTAGLWEFALYLSKKFAAENGADTKSQSAELAFIKAFEKELLTKRNKVMHKRALPLLEKGNVFIAVGALHLPGKNGLVTLLQRSGYMVSAVY